MDVSLAVTAFLVAVTALNLPAFETECKPGELSACLRCHRDTSTLVVTGTVDASDLFFIADSLPALTQLDLSGAAISAYSGKNLKGSPVYPTGLIPAGTFGGSKLQSVALPTGITIGAMAFASTPLRSITVPDGAKAESGAFADCRRLAEATVRGDISEADFVFRNCTSLLRADLCGAKAVAEGSFAGCASLSAVEGAENLKEIGAEAFYGTSALKDFPFAPGLTAIGDRSFASSGLTAAILPESLSSTGKGAFSDCRHLAKAVIPSGMTQLSDYLFAGTPLADLPLPEHLQSIGRYSLKGNSLVAVVFPSGFESIGDGAMEASQHLRSLDVRTLESVPQTGADVWKGIDATAVKLYTGINRTDFENAPQWQDFDIAGDTAGAAPPTVLAGVRADITDGILTLETEGTDISRVAVFKASGTLLLDISPDAPVCVADLRGFTKGSAVIVAATLADGSQTTLKFAL